MNPLMRRMQQQQQRNDAAPKNSNKVRGGKKAQRRPPPPARSRFMSSPPTMSQMPTQYARPVNYDERLTHLSQLFPDIDSPVIMDILQQKRGDIEAATRDLFQLTNPTSIDSVDPSPAAEKDLFELPPCYDDLDAEFYFPVEKSIEVNASLPVFTKEKTRGKPSLMHHDHPELKRFNTSVGIVRPKPVPLLTKDYLLKWKKGQTNWLNVNGKNILIGPLPDDFLRVQRAPPLRAQSLPDTTVVQSPIYKPPPPISAGPNDEISRTREGRISPFRLPLKLEELDLPPDPDETENQLFEDLKLAHYLQNIEFLQQVRKNQQLYSEINQAANMDPSQLHSPGTLKRMDKATKKKLTKLAKKLPKNNFQVY